jgi:hypothetical protein
MLTIFIPLLVDEVIKFTLSKESSFFSVDPGKFVNTS